MMETTLDAERSAEVLRMEAERNAQWRRTQCVNLIPSEQPTSEFVDRLIVSEPAARYNEHQRAPSQPAEAQHVRYYKGTDFIMEKEEQLKDSLRSFFNCRQVEARVISGQMANDTVFDALKQFRKTSKRSGLSVLVHSLRDGGHLSAQPMGALKNYVAENRTTGKPAVWHFPAEAHNPHQIDIEKTKQLIVDAHPELIVFGRSVILQNEPVREITTFILREFGADNPDRPVVMYDGAHVLGLIGPHFQDPLAEGADILTGSTHKTFFGPQRGVIMSNITTGSPLYPLWTQIEARAFPGHISNHHLGTMLGLLGATYEMIRYRNEYPDQVIRNARAFASALASHGLSVEGDANIGFTETHQVVLRIGPGSGHEIAQLLEDSNIITNAQALHDDAGFAAASGLRLGTQEMTRYGMKEDDFAELGGLMADIIRAREAKRSAVTAFRSRYTEMRYCL